MAETHELRLKIDADAAKRGATEFKGALESVRRAVRDLERDSAGAFTSLRRVDTSGLAAVSREANTAAKSVQGTGNASDRAADRIRKLAIQSANALRVSTDQASRLRERLLSVGDTQGLARLEAGLDRLRTSLTNATSAVDVREARSAYADLASQLNRTSRESERFRADANAAARAQDDAARSAADHARELDRLRAKYNPLFSASKQYETALEEINRAESEGALSSQVAAQARTRAAAQLGAASAAADQYSASLQRNTAMTQQGVMVGHQLSDVLIVSQMGFQSVGMIALQQGSQLAAQMNTLKASGGGVFRTLLSGFSSLVNPLSLITIGAVAAGAAITKWFLSAGEETRSFSDSLSDANSRISELRSATDALAGNNLRRLREEYGAVNSELDAHLERLRKVAELEAGMANSALIDSIRGELTSDGNIFTNDVDAVRRAFETTNDRARTLLNLMQDVKRARTFEEQADAVTRLRQAVESTTGGLDRAEGSAAGVLTQLVRSEDAALRLLAAQNGTTKATDNASAAASNLAGQVGTAANEAARLLANLGSAPAALGAIGKSVQEQIGAIQAQNKALNLQISQGLSSAAANRRVQLGTVLADARANGQNVGVENIAPRLEEIAALEKATKEQQALRKQLSAANAPARTSGGGGGGRAAALRDEKSALEELNTGLRERLTGLQTERLELELLASGQFETAEGARAMAEAQIAMGGNVDATTAALIRQIDAAQQVGNEMRRAANEGAQGWLNSVPTYQEANRIIEEDILDSLSNEIAEFARTGKFDFERLASSILATMTDLAAQLAVKELFGGGGGEGSFLSGLFGGGGGSDGGFLAGIFGAGSEGGISGSLPGRQMAPIAAFQNAPHFAEGTANTSGIPSILHPNEAVIPLSKGRKIPVDLGGAENGAGGGQTVQHFNWNISTPDADSFRKSQKQLTSDAFAAGRRAASQNE
jgi:hypothetical protein